jgi:hypothetical protein
MYLVGNNGTIGHHSSAFVKLTFDAEEPHKIGDVPFSVL